MKMYGPSSVATAGLFSPAGNMTKFIVVNKTLADVGVRRPDQKHLPPNFPVETEEFEASNLKAAQELYPGKLVMLASTYTQGYEKALIDLYGSLQPKKPGTLSRLFRGR